MAIGALALVRGRVRVYRNLARRDAVVYSALGPDSRLQRHAKRLVVSDVKFVVRQGGRQRVLRERRKNVHAFVTGTVKRTPPVRGKWARVGYNPYKFRSFVKVGSSTPVHEADYVCLDNTGVWAINPR